MLLNVSQDQVLNYIILSVKNNISEFSKVLDYVFGFKISVDCNDVIIAEFEV
jgi:hypothetical protein